MRRQHQLPSTALRVGPDLVRLSTSVCDLIIFIHAEASSADSFRVFRCAAQASQQPAFSPGVCLSEAGHSAGSESAGLQESSDSECQCHPPDGNQKGFLVPSTANAITALLHPSLTTSLRHSPAFIGCARLSAFKLALLIFRSLHGLA